jgi:hypothetical protein
MPGPQILSHLIEQLRSTFRETLSDGPKLWIGTTISAAPEPQFRECREQVDPGFRQSVNGLELVIRIVVAG